MGNVDLWIFGLLGSSLGTRVSTYLFTSTTEHEATYLPVLRTLQPIEIKLSRSSLEL